MLHKLSVEVSGTDVLLVNDQGATVAVLPTYGDSETMNQQLERAYLFAGADELARSARATASCMAAQLHTPGGPRGDALDLLIAARDHLRQALNNLCGPGFDSKASRPAISFPGHKNMDNDKEPS